MDCKQNEHKIFAYGVDSIMDCLERISVQKLCDLFPGLDPDKVARPIGAVDVMIGLNYAGFHPVPSKEYKIQGAEKGHLRVLESQFSTGLLLDGRHSLLEEHAVISSLAQMYGRSPIHKVNLVRTKNPVDSFFKMEELGTVVPARCPSHRDCTKCLPQAEMFTQREQK